MQGGEGRKTFPRFAFSRLDRGQFPHVQPISQVGAINFECVANLAGAKLSRQTELSRQTGVVLFSCLSCLVRREWYFSKVPLPSGEESPDHREGLSGSIAQRIRQDSLRASL